MQQLQLLCCMLPSSPQKVLAVSGPFFSFLYILVLVVTLPVEDAVAFELLHFLPGQVNGRSTPLSQPKFLLKWDCQDLTVAAIPYKRFIVIRTYSHLFG